MILVLVFYRSALATAGGLYFINLSLSGSRSGDRDVVGGLLMVAGGEIAVTGFKHLLLQSSAGANLRLFDRLFAYFDSGKVLTEAAIDLVITPLPLWGDVW